ncbi:stabilizer of axonemal microtubules 2-like [Pelobates fuscus]|uniref:stabilizer of axonemal microtubules 2-like n=1 Tax=Pelobates fuscus TaxID=191477 RepID=UPI002FE4B21B
MDFETTYKMNFNRHNVKPVTLLRPVERQQDVGKFCGTPTYKSDFKQWDIQKRELIKQPNIYQPPVLRFGHSTTSQNDYYLKKLTLNKSLKPEDKTKRSSLPFDHTTSYSISYVPHKLAPKFETQIEEYKPSGQRFEHQTTHRLTYKGALGEKAKSFKPEQTTITNNDKFEGTSETKDSFLPQLLPSGHDVKTEEDRPTTFKHKDNFLPKLLPFCRLVKTEEDKPTNAPTELESTVPSDYVPSQLSLVKTESPAKGSKASIKGNCNTKDFKSGKVQGQERKKSIHLPKISATFNGLTTSQTY